MVHKLLCKQHKQTTKKKEGLPKRLMLARNKNENSMYGQYIKINKLNQPSNELLGKIKVKTKRD